MFDSFLIHTFIILCNLDTIISQNIITNNRAILLSNIHSIINRIRISFFICRLKSNLISTNSLILMFHNVSLINPRRSPISEIPFITQNLMIRLCSEGDIGLPDCSLRTNSQNRSKRRFNLNLLNNFRNLSKLISDDKRYLMSSNLIKENSYHFILFLCLCNMNSIWI